MNDAQYQQAQDRIKALAGQAPDLSWEELHELEDLMEACQAYQDALDQDAAAEEEQKKKQEANDQIAMSMGYL